MVFFGDSNYVVALSLILFIGLLIYLKVPSKVAGLLDARAEKIRAELEEARRLREEAQTLLASYERKQKEVEGQAEQIVANAKAEAERAAEEAKADLARSIERRIKSAEDQISSAEAGAMKEVRDRAVAVAIEAAREAIAAQMTDEARAASISDAIKTVDAKLH